MSLQYTPTAHFDHVMRSNSTSQAHAYDAPTMYRIEGITKPAGDRKLTMEDTEDLANQMMNAKQKKDTP